MHWSDKYLGLEFVPGTFDCVSLVEKVRREVFNQNIAMPSERENSPFWRNSTIRSNMERFVAPTKNPVDGDAVLLLVRGRIQHVGIYCLIQGEAWVLHIIEKMASHRIRVRELVSRGYRIEGYYRWI